MKTGNHPKRKTGKSPTFREILRANPIMERNLFMAAVCFGLVGLMFLGLCVYGLVLYLGKL